MRRSRRPILIASRRSRLARAQAQLIGQALSRRHPGLEVRYIWIESEGDRRTATTLSESGGKGLFVRAVEDALLAGRADIAVHSLKDMPVQTTPGLAIAATPTREDVRDVLIAGVGVRSLSDLPAGATLGTSGPRRAAQVRRLRPDLLIKPIRGNVETRLGKVLRLALALTEANDGPLTSASSTGSAESYDATLLALAGLRRADLLEYAHLPLEVDAMLPAAGQGALAVQCRADDHVSLTRCLPLNDPTTAAAVQAERVVVAGLAGDCHSPIAVYAQPIGVDRFRLRARVLSPDGRICLEVDEQAASRNLTKLAGKLVRDLQSRGADTVMRGVATGGVATPV